jgi:hypothetical protein
MHAAVGLDTLIGVVLCYVCEFDKQVYGGY